MTLILTALLVITSCLLILLVLLHKGRGGGLSDMFGGGSSTSVEKMRSHTSSSASNPVPSSRHRAAANILTASRRPGSVFSVAPSAVTSRGLTCSDTSFTARNEPYQQLTPSSSTTGARSSARPPGASEVRVMRRMVGAPTGSPIGIPSVSIAAGSATTGCASRAWPARRGRVR